VAQVALEGKMKLPYQKQKEEPLNKSGRATSILARTRITPSDRKASLRSLDGRAVLTDRIAIEREDLDTIHTLVHDFYAETGRSKTILVAEFNPESVKAWLTDPDRKAAGEKPRIEERMIGTDVVQLALGFKDNAERTEFYKFIEGKVPEGLIELRTAGSTTVEVAIKGVSKSTSIRFLNDPVRFGAALDQMGYIPGAKINARLHRSIVVADADGTIWETPRVGESPELRNLGNSPARDDILEYLRIGGILVINSGNDPMRVTDKILEGLPEEERASLQKNILLGASGGNALLCFTGDGDIEEIDGYREVAHKLPETSEINMDVVYLGDDARPTGNDWDAFELVGPERAVCVSTKRASSLPLELQPCAIQGEENGTKQFFKVLCQRAMPGEKLFDKESVSSIVKESRVRRNDDIFQGTLAVMERLEMMQTIEPEIHEELQEAVRTILSLSENPTNFQIAKESTKNVQVSDQIAVFSDRIGPEARADYIYQQNLEQRRTDPKLSLKVGEVIKGHPSYGAVKQLNGIMVKCFPSKDAFLSFNNEFATAMQAPLCITRDGTKPTSLEASLSEGFDAMLINGNNDTRQIDYIATLLRRTPPDKLPKTIIISGFGGHGTSKGSIFSHSEAETFKEQLMAEVGHIIAANDIRIILEPNATNSGENVQFSVEKLTDNGSPKKILISGTPSAIMRQTLSFAKQSGEYPWESLTMLPPEPGSTIFESYYNDEDTAIVSTMCNLRELGSFLDYMVRTDYLEAFYPEGLDEFLPKFFDIYATLSESKPIPKEEIESFCQNVKTFIENKKAGGPIDLDVQASLLKIITPINQFYRDSFAAYELEMMSQRTEENITDQMHKIYSEHSRSFHALVE